MPRALQALRPKRSPCGRRRERGGCANQHPPALVLQLGLQIVRNPAAKTRNHRRTRLKDSTTRRGTGMSGQHNLLPRPSSILANRRKGAATLRQRGRHRVACQTPVQSCERETLGWLDQRRCATEERREGAGGTWGLRTVGVTRGKHSNARAILPSDFLWLWRWRRYVHVHAPCETWDNDG